MPLWLEALLVVGGTIAVFAIFLRVILVGFLEPRP
jgi:hypothetical protein